MQLLLTKEHSKKVDIELIDVFLDIKVYFFASKKKIGPLRYTSFRKTNLALTLCKKAYQPGLGVPLDIKKIVVLHLAQ
jgi:hypothetical protein